MLEIDAAKNSNWNIVSLLLERGADDVNVNTKDTGSAVLMHAVIINHTGLFSILLDRGADISTKDYSDFKSFDLFISYVCDLQLTL